MSNSLYEGFINEVKGALNKGGSGSGGGAQPDMNAAPGEPGHILNRTHYKEHYHRVILEESEMPYDENEGFMIDIAEIPPAGFTATTIWNGVTYTSKVYDLSALAPGTVAFGNFYALMGDEAAAYGIPTVDTGEPFMIICAGMDGSMLLTAIPVDDSTALTLSVSVEGEIVHKIPSEYVDEVPIFMILNDGGTFLCTGSELNAAYDAHKLIVFKMVGDSMSTFSIIAGMTRPDETGRRYYTLVPLNGGITKTLIVDKDDISFSNS